MYRYPDRDILISIDTETHGIENIDTGLSQPNGCLTLNPKALNPKPYQEASLEEPRLDLSLCGGGDVFVRTHIMKEVVDHLETCGGSNQFGMLDRKSSFVWRARVSFQAARAVWTLRIQVPHLDLDILYVTICSLPLTDRQI